MIDTPCYHCTERHMKCHTECEKYAKYQKDYKEMKKKLEENLAPTYMIVSDGTIERMDKARLWIARGRP